MGCEKGVVDDMWKLVAEYFSVESFGMKPFQPVVSEAVKIVETTISDNSNQNGCQYDTATRAGKIPFF